MKKILKFLLTIAIIVFGILPNNANTINSCTARKTILNKNFIMENIFSLGINSGLPTGFSANVDFVPTLGEDSAYIVKEVSSLGKDCFEYKTIDDNGNVVTKYYMIILNTKNMRQNVAWSETKTDDSTGSITITLPNGEPKTLYYAYVMPDDYTVATKSLTTIKADDVTNKVFSNLTATQKGGAIYNQSDVSDITIKSDFIGNYLLQNKASATQQLCGGAIGNYGKTGNIQAIDGDFYGNYISSTTRANGGAICNYGGATIGTITGNFVGNYSINNGSSTKYYSYGGSIYNSGTITGIAGNFIDNYAYSLSTYSYGGAIGNYGDTAYIESIIGDFIGNYTNSEGYSSYGGAIFNSGKSAKIESIIGDFIGNYSSYSGTSTKYYSYGGVIYNTATITTLKGNFISNSSNSSTSNAYGGAIGNYGTSAKIDSISGDFIGNYVRYTGTTAKIAVYGGAIYNANSASIGSISGSFSNNYVEITQAYGGAINNQASIEKITADFIGNYTNSLYNYSQGGAIHNSGTITTLIGNFTGNYSSCASASGSNGGAICNTSAGIITTLTGNFVSNYVSTQDIKSKSLGGAIYNGNSIGLVNSSFIDNYAYSQNGTAQGGAIYTKKDLTVTADSGKSLFSGNYTQIGNNDKVYNAIYLSDSSITLTLNSINNGVITLEDNINGETGYNLALTGDFTGIINIHNDILGTPNLTVSDVGEVSFADGVSRNYQFTSFKSNSSTKYGIDIDVQNKTSDTFTVSGDSSLVLTLDSVRVSGGGYSTRYFR